MGLSLQWARRQFAWWGLGPVCRPPAGCAPLPVADSPWRRADRRGPAADGPTALRSSQLDEGSGKKALEFELKR